MTQKIIPSSRAYYNALQPSSADWIPSVAPAFSARLLNHEKLHKTELDFNSQRQMYLCLHLNPKFWTEMKRIYFSLKIYFIFKLKIYSLHSEFK